MRRQCPSASREDLQLLGLTRSNATDRTHLRVENTDHQTWFMRYARHVKSGSVRPIRMLTSLTMLTLQTLVMVSSHHIPSSRRICTGTFVNTRRDRLTSPPSSEEAS